MIIGLCGLAGSGKDTVADLLVEHHGFVKVAFADPLKRICQDVLKFTDEQLWGPSAMRNTPDERYVRLKQDQCEDLFNDQIDAWHTDKPEVALHTFLGLTKEEYADFVEHGVVHLTPRYALQQLGSEWGRNCTNDVWVRYALRIADMLKAGGLYYDVKYGMRFLSMVQRDSDWMKGKSDVVISDVRFFNEVDAINNKGGKVWKIDRPGAGLQGAAGSHVSETQQLGIPPEHFSFTIHNDGSLNDLKHITKSALDYAKENA